MQEISKVTIYDVAKEASISPSMVSRVINGSGPVFVQVFSLLTQKNINKL